jgi:nitric oxide reductase activation protein
MTSRLCPIFTKQIAIDQQLHQQQQQQQESIDHDESRMVSEKPLLSSPTNRVSTNARHVSTKKDPKEDQTQKPSSSAQDEDTMIPKTKKKADAKEKYSLEPQEGERVYSCFPGNGTWYWGKVTKKYYKKDGSLHFSVSTAHFHVA